MLLRTLRGHKKKVRCVAMTGDSQRIATGSEDETIIVWDARTDDLICTLESRDRDRRLKGPVSCMDISKDGTRLVCGYLNMNVMAPLKLWTLNHDSTPAEPLTLMGHGVFLQTVKFSPDGQKIAGAAANPRGSLGVWSAQSGELLLTFAAHWGSLFRVVWSRDGNLVASAGEEAPLIVRNGAHCVIRVFEAATGTQVREFEFVKEDVLCLEFGATSDVLYSGGQDNIITIWNLAEGRMATVTRRLQGHTGTVRGISVSPDEKYLASASEDKTVRLWEVATGQQIRVLEGHTGEVFSVVWSRDGEMIVSGGGDNTACIWGLDAQVRFASLGQSSQASQAEFLGIHTCIHTSVCSTSRNIFILGSCIRASSQLARFGHVSKQFVAVVDHCHVA